MYSNIRIPKDMKEDFDLGCARLEAWSATRRGLTAGRVYKGEATAQSIRMLGILSLARPSMLEQMDRVCRKIDDECVAVGDQLRCGKLPVEVLLAYRALLACAEDQDMEGLKITWERMDGAVKMLPEDVREPVMRRIEQEVDAMLEVRQDV